jgi:hypothetical protein
MVIGRGRRREHPMDTSEGVTWPSVTTGVAQLSVAHAHTQGNPEGVTWPLVTSGSHVTTVLLYGHAQNLLPVRTTSGQGLFQSRDCHFRSKGPTRADMAQLPVAHAQNILPDRVTSCHVTDVTSSHVTSGHAQWSDPPQMLTELYPYTTEEQDCFGRAPGTHRDLS